MDDKGDEEWSYPGNNPSWSTNFKVKINKKGLWKIESNKYCRGIYGKWLMNLEKKEGCPNYPTFADQNNFMSALLEVDWHNDTFKFPDGSTRCSSFGNPPTNEFLKRLRLFQDLLNFYKGKYNGQTKLGDYGEKEDGESQTV